MCPAVQPLLEIAQKWAHIINEIRKAIRIAASLNGMHLVPKIPGENDPAATPAFGSEGKSRLYRLARCPAGQQLPPRCTWPAICPVIGMKPPTIPEEECVERRKQQAQSHRLAEAHEIVPET